MTNERWQQLKDIFNDALERTPDERDAFLAEACAGDAELRQEVEALLAECEQQHSPLDSLAGAVAAQMAGKKTNGHFASGQMIGPYQLQERLGAGGMGEVFRADDTRLGRQVAVKLLHLHLADSHAAVARFKREAKAVAALSHPNIVALYDFGESHEICYAVTELLEGETLRARLKRGALDWQQAVALALEICDGLTAAHAKGIIHRDLKPENIFLTTHGPAKILDFGIARIKRPILPEDAATQAAGITYGGATMPGMILGTAGYMSPEQVRGEEVDAPGDVFALGCVLQEMLTGKAPFARPTPVETLAAILHEAPASLTGVAPPLARIIQRCLAKDAKARYLSVQSLSEDLLSVREGRASTRFRGWRQAMNSRRRLFGALAVGVLLGVLAWWLWRVVTRRSVEVSPWLNAQVAPLADASSVERFPSLAPDGQRVVYARELNGQWDIFLQQAGGHSPVNLTADSPAEDTHPAFSPDGLQVAFYSARNGGGLYVMSASGGAPRLLVPGNAFHPAWSPDNQELLFTEERIHQPSDRGARSLRHCWAINVATQAKRLLSQGDIAQPQWSPHRQRIAYWGARANAQRDIWTMSADGQNAIEVTNDAALDWNPVWSPDGRYLYFISDRGGSPNLWRVAVDEQTGQVLGPPDPLRAPCPQCSDLTISRTGNHIAYAQVTSIYTLQRWGFDRTNWALRGPATTRLTTTYPIAEPQLSPDGSFLALRSTRANREDLALLPTQGTDPPELLTDDDYRDRGPAWSPDGRQLAFYSNRDGKWGIWAIHADGSDLRVIVPGSTEGSYIPRWSPDGKQLVFTRRASEPFVTSVMAPAPCPLLPVLTPRPIVWAADWSPDGQRVLGSWRAKQDEPLTLISYELATQQFTRLGNLPLRSVVWLSDSRWVLGLDQGKLKALDTQTLQMHEIDIPEAANIRSFTLSRDARTIYFNLEIPSSDIWQLTLK